MSKVTLLVLTILLAACANSNQIKPNSLEEDMVWTKTVQSCAGFALNASETNGDNPKMVFDYCMTNSPL
ncbi:hypothetical protein ASL83_003489 [Vibrio parahaemolyticus]|nr:hypothetical protein [Vibrio parahaemolyticus]EJO2025535.1 hypothetical protein [Vibrio parahaemolyticus]ELA8176478.1 hypothetical protein [Vibrio alginolyticus]